MRFLRAPKLTDTNHDKMIYFASLFIFFATLFFTIVLHHVLLSLITHTLHVLIGSIEEYNGYKKTFNSKKL